MAGNLSTYTFAPWRMRDGKYVVASEATWRKPARWNRGAADGRHRPRVLLTYDVFEDWTGTLTDTGGNVLRICHPCNGEKHHWQIACKPGCEFVNYRRFATMTDVRTRLLRLIDQTPNIDWIIPTERPEGVLRMVREMANTIGGVMRDKLDAWAGGMAPANIWLGAVIRNQQEADERIPHLLKVPAAVRFLSCELRVAVRFDAVRGVMPDGTQAGPGKCSPPYTFDALSRGIHWVIVSGGKEPLHPDWARSLRDQCQAAGVPFHFEGWGAWAPVGTFAGFCDYDAEGRDLIWMYPDGRFERPKTGLDAESMLNGGTWLARVGKRAAGRLLDGREWNEFPNVEAQQ